MYGPWKCCSSSSLAVILLQQIEKRAARARQMMGSPVGTVADTVPELQPALVAVNLIELSCETGH